METTQFGQNNHNHKPLLVAIFLLLLLVLCGMIAWGLYYFRVWPWNNRAVDNNSSLTDQNSNNNSNNNNGSTTITDTPKPTTTTGTGGTTTPTPTSAASATLLNLYASVNNGDTKQEVAAKVSGLSQSCSVTVNTTVIGKQEVCAYTDGSKVVTITYLNDKVINVFR
jgi:cytoskeletal protein RodZ